MIFRIFMLFCFAAMSAVPQVNFPVKEAIVNVTAYTSSPMETDDDPWTAAWNNKLHPGDKVVAVSRDLEKRGLKNGVRVMIEGEGFYVVKDRMNKRKKDAIDIWFGVDREGALRFGRKRLKIYWIGKS